MNKDKDLVFIAFQVSMPSFQSFNDSQEFLIVSFIPSLSKNYFLGEKRYLVLFTNFRFRTI